MQLLNARPLKQWLPMARCVLPDFDGGVYECVKDVCVYIYIYINIDMYYICILYNI